MKPKNRYKLLQSIKDYKDIIFILLAVVATIMFFVHYLPAQYVTATIAGLATITGIIITALFALKKYHAEQRINRLQEIYFETAFLGQAESIEEMMSQVTNNTLLVENLFILLFEILTRQHVNIEIIKNDLNSIIDVTLNDIKAAINTADFKKETISILLKDAGIKGNYLLKWIKKYQEDAYRFSAFLKTLLVILKSNISRLDASNLENNIGNLIQIKECVKNNYFLINRHYILFSLFSEFILFLVFSRENYADIDVLYNALNKNECKKILELINECYINLVADYIENVDFGEITDKQATQLKERIKCAAEKIAQL
jgi:hypothetical protein